MINLESHADDKLLMLHISTPSFIYTKCIFKSSPTLPLCWCPRSLLNLMPFLPAFHSAKDTCCCFYDTYLSSCLITKAATVLCTWEMLNSTICLLFQPLFTVSFCAWIAAAFSASSPILRSSCCQLTALCLKCHFLHENKSRVPNSSCWSLC